MSYAGCTLASFVFPIVLQAVLDHFDLRTALITLSLIAFSSLAAAWPFTSKIKSDQEEEEGSDLRINRSLIEQFEEDLKVLKLPSFWVVTVFYVVFIYVFVILIIILPDLAVDRGLGRQSAAFLISIHSIGDFAGRLIPGYLHYLNVVHNQVTVLVFSLNRSTYSRRTNSLTG